MNYKFLIIFMMLSFTAFSEKSYSANQDKNPKHSNALKMQKKAPRGQTLPYCCCSDTNCVSGDNQHCCTHSEHPIAVADCNECEGVSLNGDLLTDPNVCHNSQNIGQPCY